MPLTTPPPIKAFIPGVNTIVLYYIHKPTFDDHIYITLTRIVISEDKRDGVKGEKLPDK